MVWPDYKIDLELVAALIDHRLSVEEQADVVRLLARSDEALELFANAVRVRPDIDRRTTVWISTARRWRGWTVAVPLAAASVLAVVVPPIVKRSDQPLLSRQYAVALTQNATSSAQPAADEWDEPQWSLTRGAGALPDTVLIVIRSKPSELKNACRLGVRSLDLQVALERSDTALARGLTSEIIDDLNTIGLSEPVILQYKELQSRFALDAPARSIERASSIEAHLRGLVDSSTFAFGQWIAAAELAARTHNASFFASDLGSNMLRSPITPGSIAAEHAEVLRSIAVRLQQPSRNQVLDDVHRDVDAIIQRCGG